MNFKVILFLLGMLVSVSSFADPNFDQQDEQTVHDAATRANSRLRDVPSWTYEHTGPNGVTYSGDSPQEGRCQVEIERDRQGNQIRIDAHCRRVINSRSCVGQYCNSPY